MSEPMTITIPYPTKPTKVSMGVLLTLHSGHMAFSSVVDWEPAIEGILGVTTRFYAYKGGEAMTMFQKHLADRCQFLGEIDYKAGRDISRTAKSDGSGVWPPQAVTEWINQQAMQYGDEFEIPPMTPEKVREILNLLFEPYPEKEMSC
ncbi:MAG: hypothetical protein WAZ18_03140 [Alphaproteobacteria bacterium]